MKPALFKEANSDALANRSNGIHCVGRESVPCLRANTPSGDPVVIFCFKLSRWERLKIALTGKIYHHIYPKQSTAAISVDCF